MPTSVIAHSAFISSPSDVEAERKITPRIISELNSVYLQATGHILWPLMWEFMSGGLGEDAQAVINRQTPGYDIFVGIVWSRFGTPTKRAGSGTEEEFDRALSTHLSGAKNFDFMVFVKEADLPNGVDEEQLRNVRAFIKKLQETGILYRTFHDITEFETLLRQHMLQYLAARMTSAPKSARAGDTELVAITVEEKPHAALVTDIVTFSEKLRRSIELIGSSKRSKFDEGRSLLHEATITLVADGGENIKKLVNWTYAYGRTCYTTTQTPCGPAERMSLVAELDGVGEQISEWRRLMGKAPLGDNGVSGDFAVAREFLDHCACAVQTSAYGLNGALRL
jgi:hypothetical protein